MRVRGVEECESSGRQGAGGGGQHGGHNARVASPAARGLSQDGCLRDASRPLGQIR